MNEVRCSIIDSPGIILTAMLWIEKRQRQRALEKNGSKIKNSAMASYIRETFGQEPETESTTGVAAST
jgi:hypothetical protein